MFLKNNYLTFSVTACLNALFVTLDIYSRLISKML